MVWCRLFVKHNLLFLLYFIRYTISTSSLNWILKLNCVSVYNNDLCFQTWHSRKIYYHTVREKHYKQYVWHKTVISFIAFRCPCWWYFCVCSQHTRGKKNVRDAHIKKGQNSIKMVSNNPIMIYSESFFVIIRGTIISDICLAWPYWFSVTLIFWWLSLDKTFLFLTIWLEL